MQEESLNSRCCLALSFKGSHPSGVEFVVSLSKGKTLGADFSEFVPLGCGYASKRCPFLLVSFQPTLKWVPNKKHPDGFPPVPFILKSVPNKKRRPRREFPAVWGGVQGGLAEGRAGGAVQLGAAGGGGAAVGGKWVSNCGNPQTLMVDLFFLKKMQQSQIAILSLSLGFSLVVLWCCLCFAKCSFGNCFVRWFPCGFRNWLVFQIVSDWAAKSIVGGFPTKASANEDLSSCLQL